MRRTRTVLLTVAALLGAAFMGFLLWPGGRSVPELRQRISASAPAQNKDMHAADSPAQATRKAGPLPVRATQPSPALRDRLTGEQMLVERWERLPDGRRRHLRIVQDAERQRPVRVVDIYEKKDGVETLVSQTAMLADRLLLSLQTPQQADALQARLAQAGYRAVPSGSPYLLLIELDAGGIDAVPAAMRDLADIAPGGAAPGPDYLRFPMTTPDDPLFPYQYAHELIGSEEAWDVTSGSSSVVVAILDTGMQLDHPDLAANLWTNPGEIPDNGIDDDGNGFKDDVHGWDVFDDDNDPSDDHGHGTHVSGIVGAVGGNGTGVTGVNGTVSLLPMRVGSQSFLSSDVVEALDYIRDLKLNRNVNVVVSNNSYSGEGYTTAEYDAIARQGEAGILFVAAAGNDGIDVDEQPRYPGALDISAIINVANSDQDDKLADGSNYGAVSVDICAPGTSIYSTAMGGDYQLWSGTSMAAPHVAGAVALAFAADPQAESAAVRTLLLEQADQVATMDGKVATGSRLSLSRLVDAVAGVSRVEVSSPGKAVSLDSLGTTLVLRAEVTVAGEAAQPESAVEWVVDPSEGVTVTAESLTQARAVFSQEGIYTLTASVETGGVVRTDTRQVVAAGRPVSSGLAAEWLFDGEGNPVDSSGNGLDAVFEGGAGRGTGVAEGAYAGTGTEGEHVRVDHLPSLPEVSVSAWVKADSEAGLFPRIVDGPEWAFFLGLTGGTDIKCLKFVRYYEDDVYSWYTPEGTIVAGQWYHVAVTWKDTDTAPSLYIDGVAQEVGGRGFKVGGLRVGGGTAYLGNGPDGNRSLDGQIDELRIYNRELSPQEVALLAANHSPVSEGLSAGTVTETQDWSPHVSVTDEDGPLDPALMWSVVSGPGEVSLSREMTDSPTFNFETTGVYRIRLESSDGSAVVRKEWAVDVGAVCQVSMTVQDGELLLMSGQSYPITLSVVPASATALSVGYSVSGDAIAGEDYQTLSGTLTVPAGEFEASFPVEALTRTSGSTRTLTLTLVDGDGYALGSDASATLALLPYTYSNWSAHYAAQVSAPSGVWSPAMDANQDGIGNLLEFALGVDPLADAEDAVRDRLPRIERGEGGALSLRYVRPENADASLYVVGSSSSPSASPFHVVASEEVVQRNGDGTETVTVSDPDALAAGETRFLFLRVSEDAQ